MNSTKKLLEINSLNSVLHSKHKTSHVMYDGNLIINISDIIAIVNIILAEGVGKGESIDEGIVIVNSENIEIQSNGSIAGFELDINGDFTLNNAKLPVGWNFHQSDSKV